MAGTNLPALEAVSKEIYQGALRKQLNNDVKTLRRIEKTSDGVKNEVGGKYVTFPIHTRRNQGIGGRHESQALPVAGRQGTAAVRTKLRYLYGAIELTGQAISLIDKDYQAFVSALDLEMDGLKTDLAKDLNRQVYGDGTGAIGYITGSDTATTIPVDKPYLFQLDMVVDIVDSDGTTVNQTGKVITGIDEDNSTVTIGGSAVAFDTGDFIVRTGAAPTAVEGNKEWTGLGALVGTQALFNINPASEPVWRSTIDDNGGSPRAVSENLLTSVVDQVYTISGETPSVGFTSLGVRRAYANLLTQQRQFVNTKQFDGGFSGIGFVTDSGEIPIVTDIDHPRNSLHFLREKDIQLYRYADWSWLDRDGSMWKQKVDSSGTYDAWVAYIHQYSELGIQRRNTQARIDNLIEN